MSLWHTCQLTTGEFNPRFSLQSVTDGVQGHSGDVVGALVVSVTEILQLHHHLALEGFIKTVHSWSFRIPFLLPVAELFSFGRVPTVGETFYEDTQERMTFNFYILGVDSTRLV